ncbi:MAG: hypothetical protein JWP61_698 [Friedmanniella sp.]|nr:hypothetical protein [Friedmanniella sp.]
MSRPVDVVALVTGVLLTGLAVAALVLSVGGSLPWATLRIAAPLLLVVLGVTGLALSRRRP